MATANEILAYNGNPELAGGSSALPLSNAVVWDTSPAVQAWTQFAQNKLAVAKDQLDQLKRKQLQSQAEIAKALDQGNYKIWAADRDLFKKKYDEFRNTVIDVAKRGKWGDVNDKDYENVLKMQGDLDQFAQYSTQQEALWNTSNNTAKSNPEKWIDPSKDLSAYQNIGDPLQRANVDLNLRPQAGWDVFKNNAEIVKGIVSENPEGITSKNIGGGNLLYTIPNTVDQQALNKKINAQLDNEVQGINGYEYEFQNQPDAIKQQYAAQDNPARAWAYDMKLNSLSLDSGSKSSIHQINYAPGTTSILNVPYQESIPIPYTSSTEVESLNKPLQDELANIQAKKVKTEADNKRISELNKEIDANSAGKVSTIYLIGGHDFTKTGNAPSNILVNPTNAHYAGTGKQIPLQQIGATAWNSDVMKEGHVYMNKNGDYILTTVPTNLQQAQDYADRHGYTLQRVALINTDAAGLFTNKNGTALPQSILVPYSDVEQSLRNSKVNLEQSPNGNVVSQPKPQPTTKTTTYVGNGTTYTHQDLINLGYSDKDISDDVRSGKLKIGSTATKYSATPKEETGTIKVILNGRVGEIPANQWEAFKKKYPSATKQ